MPPLTRRRFLGGAAATAIGLASSGLLASCRGQTLFAPAPKARMARLGFLGLTSAEDYAPHIAAFRSGMRDLGYELDNNLVIDERFADGHEELLPDLAKDLVQRQVDVLVTASTQASLSALAATRSIPIVFTNSGDPLGAGLVITLARPGANATGLTSLNVELAGKRLELLRAAAPSIARVAVLWSDAAERDVNETLNAAGTLGLQAMPFRIVGPADLEATLAQAIAARPDALVAISSPLVNSFAPQIARVALEHGLPTVSEQREFVVAGGLLGYGANAIELSQRAAVYVDKILMGARPADLPVERANVFELAVNRRIAQLLNLTLPEPLLLQASEFVS
jgi:putative tryptophan/tyrosine transport system substrate-binding protein